MIGMARLQSSMSSFLYESRVSDDLAGGFGCDGAAVNVDSVAHAVRLRLNSRGAPSI